MSGPERKTPDDELLDRYLSGQSSVSRAYRETAQPQSPPDLDVRIVDLARAGLETAASARAAHRSASRWRYPLAAAAVIVLSFGVLLNLQREQAAPAPATAPQPAPQRVQAPLPRAAAPAEQQKPAADATEERRAAKALKVAPAPAPAPAPVQAESQLQRPAEQNEAEGDAERKREAGAGSRRERAPAAALAAPGGATMDRASPASAELASPCATPAEHWQEIRRLLDEQKIEQARAAYRDFRSACPAAAVPDDLRTQIEQ